MDTWEKFEKLMNERGCNGFLLDLYDYFGAWAMDKACEDIANDWDIDLSED